MDGWHAIVPSHEVTKGDCIVQGFANGLEIALWRSASGAVQAWENRCAHRSVRLTLGRIIEDRLVCGYHGWRYAPGNGQCTYRPAHPGAPVPKGLGIRTYPVAEAAGMVWVAPAGQTPSARPPADAGYTRFCRALVVRRGVQQVAAVFPGRGRWTGRIGDDDVCVYLLPSKPDRTTLYVWCRAEAGDPLRIAAAFKKLRDSIEHAP